MSALVIPVDPTSPDAATIARAAGILRRGGLVAFPTETVYGLGANALDAAAVLRIFAAKGRPPYNPLIVHVPDLAAARALVAAWPAAAQQAAAAFWPGPLSLVLPRTAAVPDEVTGGLGTVGVRVPAHPVTLALLRAAAVPLAAPSANRFTRISPTSARHVAAELGDRVDLILDGGVTPLGIESAVLDLTGARPRLLRHGAVSHAELEAVLGPVADATRTADAAAHPADAATQPADAAMHPADAAAHMADAAAQPAGAAARSALPSPGMLGRHYAPAGELVVFEDADAAVRLVAQARARGRRVGGLLLHRPVTGLDEVIALPDDARGYARLLYASLHALDAAGCDLILVEAVPDTPAWAAVQDRLRRAARTA
jgi:L-threonylcarbamoyladenylate synthase